MSKLSFRARALDATKPLPIYHAEDLPDLSEYNTINRTVPQMPTGMEKEEELERHLQEAILSQQSNSKKNRVYIPTPEASITVPYFVDLYNRLVETPPQYIRVPGLGLEEEVPDYDLDSEDEEWLNAQTDEWPLSPTHFERMMDRLEKGSGNTVLSEREAQILLKDDDDLVLAVYDYWLAKRLRLGRALIPTVKHERRDGSSSANPYMAFRKRTEKMQTRKNRKNDEAAYMQMLKLKRDLARACSLAELVKEREDKKNDISQVQMDIFRKRYLLEDWSGTVTASLHPVVTKSATSRQGSGVGEGGQWEGRTVLIKMESGEEDDIHRVGRHEVLVSSGLKRKRKKKYYYAATTPEPEPAVPTTPDKAMKDTSRDRIAERSDDEEPDGIFSFKRKPHIKYHSPHGSLGDWPWYGSVEDDEDEDENAREGRRYRFSRTTLSGRFIGRSRRRVGRGGRALWDRITLSDSEDEAPLTAESQGVQPTEGGDQETKDEGGTTEDKEMKCLHFLSCPPSPSSDFQFHRLPLIELPVANSSNTSANPSSRVPPYGYPISSLGFGGFASDSEYSEEASSFATLPTSQFALKPSSDDMECEPSEQRKKISMSEKLELRFWNGTGDKSPSSVVDSTDGENAGNSHQVGTLSRRSTDDFTPSAPPSASSFSSSSPSFAGAQHKQQMSHPTNTARHSNNNAQQVAPRKDMSRTSLSVMDSKTIILSNAPTSAVRHQMHSSTKQTQRQSAQNSESEAVSTKPRPLPSGDTSTVVAVEKKKLVANGPKQVLPVPTSTQDNEGDVCAMNGPATNVLQLNFPLTNVPENSKNSRVLATADTALLITSQFVKQSQQFVERKRDGGVGGISSELSNASRDLQPTAKVDSLLPQVVDKRTTSLPSSRRSSTGTNGTNYQEIFHSTSRRLSETERGLKQALAGSMMNHSNLLETTASLVQLGNPSEVT